MARHGHQRRRRMRPEPLHADQHSQRRHGDRQRRQRGLGKVVHQLENVAEKGLLRDMDPEQLRRLVQQDHQADAGLEAVSTGVEMKLATKPSRSTAASIRSTPTRAVSVAVAVTSFAGSPSGTARPSSAPARIASVVVELTLRTREEPSSP